ncbi:DUF792 family protein [Borrelia hispanica]|uniref:DUF792 family protein n=1 Tax=Borrelia hispanica TaxID=40835 RepID=UPI0004B8A062|nr:DUF792 family protein [Borrelia hispanica]
MNSFQITNLIKEIVTQTLSLFVHDNFIVLFPRLDFKGLGYIPQLFFIKPKNELISITYNTSCSKRPIVNYYTRKAGYVSYNPILNSEIISLNSGVLTSFYKEIIEDMQASIFGSAILQYDSHLVKTQLNNRIEAGVPFTAFSPAFGIKEVVTLTSITLKDTPNIDEVEISLTMEVAKTFTTS